MNSSASGSGTGVDAPGSARSSGRRRGAARSPPVEAASRRRARRAAPRAGRDDRGERGGRAELRDPLEQDAARDPLLDHVPDQGALQVDATTRHGVRSSATPPLRPSTPAAEDQAPRTATTTRHLAADREADPGLGCQDGQDQAARRADLVGDVGAEVRGLVHRRRGSPRWRRAGPGVIDSGRMLISTAVPAARPSWAAWASSPDARRMAPSGSTTPCSRLVVPMKSATNRLAGRSYSSSGRAELLDPPGVHDRDPVAHRERLLLVVGHVDERDARPRSGCA